MANQADLNSVKKVFLGSMDNGNPNHYRNTKTYCKNAGSNCIVSGLIVALIGTVLVTGLDWLAKPIERPRGPKPMNTNRRKY